MIARPREELLGLAAGIGVLVMFSGMLVVSRSGATGTLTPFDMTGLRFGVAAVLTLPFLLRRRLPRLGVRQAIVLGACSGCVFTTLLFGGMAFAPVAHGAVVVNGAMPVFAALIAWVIFGERLGGWRIGGIVLIVAGVAATGWDALAFGQPGQWRGHLLFLGAAAANATFLTAVRGWRIGAIESLITVNMMNLVFYIPVWLLFLPSNLAQAPWQEIALQGVYQGIVAAVIASILIAYAARTLGGTRQAAVMSGAPALSLLMAIPLLGEVPSPISIAGVVIVTVGILITLGPQLLRPAGSAAQGKAR
ncbi:MAG: DMT family transporter [Alphaproteobacteria bacterium]|jgi:drug/metabolite transporter (DMT)-like permease